MVEQTTPEIIDYEGSNYRTDFWEGKGRQYEDQVERIAIKRLLPSSGERLLDVGAGFGRYTNMFTGYKQVVLLDYSRSQLEYARQTFGDDGYLYVAADVYKMPFAPGLFDAAVMVRVLHHMADAQAALNGIRHAMRRNGTFLLEFANKQNLKAILRWLLRLQNWSPFDTQPVEFVKLNFDFHPQYIWGALSKASFKAGRRLTVSHFRIGFVKRWAPTFLIVALDSLFQLTGGWWQLTPSVFVANKAEGEDIANTQNAFWCCPECRSVDMREEPKQVVCSSCGRKWAIVNGVYDFKEPVNLK
jgi:SAM-dependent methyltransferase